MRHRATVSVLVLLGSVLAAGIAPGCSSATGPADPKAPTQADIAAGSCEAIAGSTLRPVGNEAKTGSAIALGKMDKGKLAQKTLAFLADEDGKRITAVDVDTKTEVSALKLDAVPSQLMIMADGRLVVGLRDKAKVEVVHVADDGSMVAGCMIDTAPEPVALATTPDEKTLLVTTGWGRSLEAYDTKVMARKAKVQLPREPRSVVVDDDGKVAYVAHAVGGRLSTIELSAMKAQSTRFLVNQSMLQGEESPSFMLASSVNSELGGKGDPGRADMEVPGRMGTRVGCQGYPITKSTAPKGRILAPQVLVDPGDPENRAQGYGDGNNPTEVANVAVIDSGSRRILSASLNAESNRERFFGRDPNEVSVGECILPRAAAVDEKSQTLLVTCLGADAVVAYDAASANPATIEKVRWDVGSGPTGVAVDPENRRAIVFGQFDRSLDILDLKKVDSMELPSATRDKPNRITLKPLENPLPLGVVLGRQIFHTVGDSRVSKDGRACASCHPDGRDDAITWATPDGPRRTIMLSGRLANTEPYAWGGTSKDLRDHLTHTFERLNGQGLRSVEMEALVAYLESLPAPTRYNDADAKLVAKGKDIFHSKQAECSSCHVGGMSDGKAHDVGSRTSADRKATFNTPALTFLEGRDSFFHDGRYSSLRDLLVKSDGLMGKTKQLSPEDLTALEAYLRSL